MSWVHRQAADWALEEEVEYWDRALAESAPGSGSSEFLVCCRAEPAAELERRKRLFYCRAGRPFALTPVIAEVKARTDLVALFDHYCVRRLTIRSLEPKAVKYTCPVHDDRDPSLTVWPEKGRWWCFGACNQGGDAIAAVMVLENLAFVPAVLELAKRCGVIVPERPRRKGLVERRGV